MYGTLTCFKIKIYKNLHNEVSLYPGLHVFSLLYPCSQDARNMFLMNLSIYTSKYKYIFLFLSISYTNDGISIHDVLRPVLI